MIENELEDTTSNLRYSDLRAIYRQYKKNESKKETFGLVFLFFIYSIFFYGIMFLFYNLFPISREGIIDAAIISSFSILPITFFMVCLLFLFGEVNIFKLAISVSDNILFFNKDRSHIDKMSIFSKLEFKLSLLKDVEDTIEKAHKCKVLSAYIKPLEENRNSYLLLKEHDTPLWEATFAMIDSLSEVKVQINNLKDNDLYHSYESFTNKQSKYKDIL